MSDGGFDTLQRVVTRCLKVVCVTSLSRASRRISSARTSRASSLRTSWLSTGLRSMAEYSRPDSFMNTETIARGSSPASPPAPAQSHTTPAHPAVQKHLHHTVPARTTHPVRCRFCPSWSRRRCRGAGFLHAERLAPSPVWCDRRPPAESSPAQKSAPVRNVT